MDVSAMVLPGVMLGMVVLMLVIGVFNRVIAKIGLRNFFRHRSHAAISVAGLLVGTSIICASMVVGDSIEYFIVEDAYNQLQLVDMVVTTDTGVPFNASVLTALEGNASLAELTDGMAPLLVQPATVRDTNSNLFEPSVNVIGFDPQADTAFGDFLLADGISGIPGTDLGPNDTMMNQALADNLGASEGDHIVVTYSVGGLYGMFGDQQTRILDVKHILADKGKAIFNPRSGMSADTYNLFVNMDTAWDMFGEPGMYTHIKISNSWGDGGVVDGAKGSDQVAGILEPVVGNLTFHSEDTVMAYAPNQTFFMLDHNNLDETSVRITVNGTVLDASTYQLDPETGTLILFTPMQLGRTASVSYDYTYPLVVNSEKQDRLDAAKSFNDIVSTFLTIFGSFAIIAGVILIINIFTMLAEERKSELGMARAVGMKRKHLMLSFLYEGLAYGSVASAAGVLVGLGVGRLLIYYVNEFVNFLDIQIPFHFHSFSLVRAFSMGFVITFGTILLTSWKISKLNIIRAIRGIEAPKREKKGFVMLSLGFLLLAVSTWVNFRYPGEHLVQLLAPSGMITGAAMVLWRWVGDRTAVTGSSLGVFIYTFYAIRTYFGDVGTDEIDTLFILSGVIVVLSLVLLIMYNSRPVILLIVNTIGRVRRFRPMVMTAVSYPLTKRFRTGMSVAMFALVVYMIVMLSVFSSMFVVDVNEETLRQGGGYDIIASTQFPIQGLDNITDPTTGMPVSSGALNGNISGYTTILYAPSPYLNITRSTGESNNVLGIRVSDMVGAQVFGIDESMYEGRSFEFTHLMDGYDAAGAWEAVMEPGSHYAIASTFTAMLLGFQEGDAITLDNILGNTSQEYTIVGVLDVSLGELSGVYLSTDNFLRDFRPWSDVILFDVAGGHDVEATARALENDFWPAGMNAVVVRDVAETTMETTNSLFALFEIYLDMGLVVGVAGLGVITVRSVVERTPEIGILRSLGFKRSNVRNAFLIEILFVATMGVGIGVVTGVMVSHEIFSIVVGAYSQSIRFTVPWLKIAGITAIAYLATILCTIVPARNASKVAPAEALRYVG